MLEKILNYLFFRYDRDGLNYCILRNYKYLPQELSSSDIDFLIDKKHEKTNKQIIIDIAKQFNLKIYHFFKDERMVQFFLFKKIDNANLFFLKLDFFFQSELYGCRFISNKDLLKNKKRYKNFYVADDIDCFLDKNIYLYLLNAPIPEKYLNNAKKLLYENNDTLEQKVKSILGHRYSNNFLKAISNENSDCFNRIRLHDRIYILIRLFFKSPFFHSYHFFVFLYYRIKLRLLPQGSFFCLSGPDGVGKTTLIDIISRHLSPALRFNTKNIFHHRPGLIPRIAEIAKKIHIIDNVNNNYSEPHRGRPSGFIVSFGRLLYYVTDYIIGYFFKIRPLLVKRETICFDRYYYDIIADCERSNISLPRNVLMFFLRIIPVPDIAFYIHASPESILSRKQELSPEMVDKLSFRYQAISKKRKEFVFIHNDGEPHKTAISIVEMLISYKAKKIKL